MDEEHNHDDEAPPRWRFVRQAKKTEGYSSRSAGRFVQGLSAQELAGKYDASSAEEVDDGNDNHLKCAGKLVINQGPEEFEDAFDSNSVKKFQAGDVKHNRIVEDELEERHFDELATSKEGPEEGPKINYPVNESIKLDVEIEEDPPAAIDVGVEEIQLSKPDVVLTEKPHTDAVDIELGHVERKEADVEEQNLSEMKDAKKCDETTIKPHASNEAPNNNKQRFGRIMCALVLILLCSISALLGVMLSKKNKNENVASNVQEGEGADGIESISPVSPLTSPPTASPIVISADALNLTTEFWPVFTSTETLNLKPYSPPTASPTVISADTKNMTQEPTAQSSFSQWPTQNPSITSTKPSSLPSSGSSSPPSLMPSPGPSLQLSSSPSSRPSPSPFSLPSSSPSSQLCGVMPKKTCVKSPECIWDISEQSCSSLRTLAAGMLKHEPPSLQHISAIIVATSKTQPSLFPYFSPSFKPSPTPSSSFWPSTMPSPVPSFSTTQPTCNSSHRNIVFPPNNPVIPCRESIEAELEGHICGLDGKFCGFCQWKFSSYNCYQRVSHLIRVYQMTNLSARQGLINQGHCSVPEGGFYGLSADIQSQIEGYAYCNNEPVVMSDGMETPTFSQPTVPPTHEPTVSKQPSSLTSEPV